MAGRMAAIVAALAMTAGMAYGQDAAKPEKDSSTKQSEKTKKLAVGEKAPPLTIEKWVKGEPVTGFEKGRIYVVEFWATWCGPCIASMPHLSELQKEYKDQVTIIGVTSKDPGNPLAKVQEMVEAKGPGMGYTVAWDTERQTYDAYMKAAGQNGIPTSFVVDREGRIAYIGHPMWLDLPLEGLTKGTWNPEEGKAKIKAANAAMMKVYQAQDPKEALAALEAFERDYPKAAGIMGDMKYTLLLKAGDPRAAALGARMVDEAIKQKDSTKLNSLAWGIVDPDADLEHRDLDLALRAAKAAVEFTHEKDAAILDTLAWAYFHKGQVEKAIELEKKAVELAPAGLKDQLKESLEKFQDKAGKS
jgi:thiol-disulfide isomerase/thioredoxin